MSRKRPIEEGGGDTWLNTYADMVTLLLTFFAVLLSMSTVNEEKFNAFIQSFSNLPQEVIQELIGSAGGVEEAESPIPGDMEALYEKLTEYVEQNNQSDAVDISKKDDVVYIRFNSVLFFHPDRYELLDSAIPTLSFIGDALKEQENSIRVINACGHTALSDGSPEVSSWLLSGERAGAVARYFDEQKGFDPTKLIVLGYGNNYPIGDNNTAEGRKQNRRVELIIVGMDSGTDAYSVLGEVYQQQDYPIDAAVDGEPFVPKDGMKPTEVSPEDIPTAPADAQQTGAADANPVDRNVSPYAE